MLDIKFIRENPEAVKDVYKRQRLRFGAGGDLFCGAECFT